MWDKNTATSRVNFLVRLIFSEKLKISSVNFSFQKKNTKISGADENFSPVKPENSLKMRKIHS